MDQFIKEWGPVISWLLTSGALVGFLKSLWDAVKRKREGVAPTEHRRRHDIVLQRDTALAEAKAFRDAYTDLRGFCIAHTPAEYMPPIPAAIRKSLSEEKEA